MAQTAAEAVRAETAQENVIEFLEARFGRVPASLALAVRTVKHPRTLKRLVRQAALAETLADFRAALPRPSASRPRRRPAR